MMCYNAGRTNDDDEQVKIELLSRWKLEAESRNCNPFSTECLFDR